jgi:hypothetical protein
MLKNILKILLKPLPDLWFTRVVYFLRHQKPLNLKHPKTFNEKITFIKLYSNNALRYLVVDRLKVRDYVAPRSSELKLVPVLWSGTSFTQEVYDTLPKEFVIKGNHGSQMVAIVDKDTTDYKGLLNKVEGWMDFDYSQKGRERVYQSLERYYVVEEKLYSRSMTPPDFKFFCFEGKVEMVQVDADRFSRHTRNLYDRDFNEMNIRLRQPKGRTIDKPPPFEKAVGIAEALSSEFSFIRVDLYLIGHDVYFGELTNYPGNGLEKFIPHDFDSYLGDKIKTLN